ncbi:MAG TPA: Mrp/NBP35 family ATP-binding protein [Gemmatimonadales bacterium]|nr:Mrp/NBP35 family ATP-binding protein [Gemmatimonadales bacterium]
MLTEDAVRAMLAEVPYPGLRRDIVSLGLVRSVAVRDDRVHVSLAVASPRADVPDQLRETVRERLARGGAVRSEVQILLPDGRLPTRSDPWAARDRLPGVKHVIAVGAGKGGVGKSTVAVNLALALMESGLRVGLLDADIYGPSVPMLVGLEDGATRIKMTDQRQILPLAALGLAVVSFGFFLGAKSPAVWRGAMVSKAVKQFSRGVVWPDLDVLVVDLPPGTGDVPLSLAQSIVVDGAVVVTTPQRLAVLEAGKAIEMFGKLDVPLLGVVENMSYAVCGCGRRSHPFGQGGGEALQRATGCTLLAQVPFDETMVAGGDAGAPAMTARPQGESATVFRAIGQQVREALGIELAQAAAARESAR